MICHLKSNRCCRIQVLHCIGVWRRPDVRELGEELVFPPACIAHGVTVDLAADSGGSLNVEGSQKGHWLDYSRGASSVSPMRRADLLQVDSLAHDAVDQLYRRLVRDDVQADLLAACIRDSERAVTQAAALSQTEKDSPSPKQTCAAYRWICGSH